MVDVKPSARRINAAVGQYVREEGTKNAFDDRAAADEWASELSADESTVWVRDANPNDSSDVDGYLMGRVSNRESENSTTSEQEGLERFGIELPVSMAAEQVPLGRFDLDSSDN